MTVTIAVVIPTRNRASYAIAAVQSLLDQEIGLDIFVSDDSTEPDQLRDFCRGEPRVRYLRPSAELSMGEHWDWALRQAMALSPASHFAVHYDRKFSKPGVWVDLAAAESKRPDVLMTFPLDFVSNQPPPLRVWQTPWTGRMFFVRTARVAELLSTGHVEVIAHTLPVLSNCVVPRTVLQSIIERFGDVCSSTGPDVAFMMRFLALNDRYVHFDRAAGILYGSSRSNGLGYMRGTGGDFPDFRKLWGDRPWLYAAPVPGVSLGSNMLFHEYELVRRETGERLPPLDMTGVLNELGAALRWVHDPQMKAQLRGLLREYGWNGPDPAPHPARLSRAGTYQAVTLFLARWFGVVPEIITGFSFRDDETALRYALKYPRRAQDAADHLALLDPEEAGLGNEDRPHYGDA
jgi:Glycosyl transferase family 2